MSTIPPTLPSQLQVNENYPDWARTPESTRVRVARIAFGILTVASIGTVITLFLTHHISMIGFGLGATAFFGTYFGILAYREFRKTSYHFEKKTELEGKEKENKALEQEKKETQEAKEAREKKKIRFEEKQLSKLTPPQPLPFTSIYETNDAKDWELKLKEIPFTPYINLNEEGPSTQTRGQVPVIGQYDKKGYRMTNPFPVVQLPESHLAQFPKKLRKMVAGKKVKVYFAVHRNPGFTSDTLNLSFHKVLFPNKNQEGDQRIKMGIFTWNEDGGGLGVCKTLDDSIAFDSLSPQRVCIHPLENEEELEEGKELVLSPNNARFRIDREKDIVAFTSVGFTDQESAVVTLSLLIKPESERVKRIIHSAGEKRSLYGLLEAIDTNDSEKIISSRVKQVFGIAPSFDSDEEDGEIGGSDSENS